MSMEHQPQSTVSSIWRCYLASGDSFDKWPGSKNDDASGSSKMGRHPKCVQTCAAVDLKPLWHQVHQPQNTSPMECKQSGFETSRLPLIGIFERQTLCVVMIFRTYKSWKLLSLMLCRTSHRTNVDESWSTLAVALRNASKCVGGTLNMPCDLINYHFVNGNKIIWQCTISICIWLFYLFVLSNWPMEVISVRRFVVTSFDTLIFNYNVGRLIEY